VHCLSMLCSHSLWECAFSKSHVFEAFGTLTPSHSPTQPLRFLDHARSLCGCLSQSGASTKSEAERSGGWCAGWYWERPGWKLDKGVLNMDKWAPDTYGRTRGFLILLASVLAVVCAILLIILLGRKHDGRPSGGVNTPRYKVNEGNVIDNWVVFQVRAPYRFKSAFAASRLMRVGGRRAHAAVSPRPPIFL
jgi:hypothetical protein